MNQTETLLQRRERLLGPSVPTFYRDPVELVHGEGVWLWDADGRRYLDCYNNVAHVGHCHPRVVAAIAKQAGTLNTHSRYLHRGILDYVERLGARFGHGLSQMVPVCTGSEANDVAMRMAQAATGRTGFIATDATYHGNTALVSQLSTRRPPVGGYAGNIRLVPAPGGDVDAEAFASSVARAAQELEEAGHGLAGLMLCPIFANEGFPDVPPGYADAAVAAVRKAGGLVLCDEVQAGFGRVGSHFWGHELLGIAPDAVSMGKPMGNGHPVAGVMTRPDIMAAFRGAFGYFNTFGGNPVSAAAANATLSVIEDEDLVTKARDVGAYARERLAAIGHPLIAGLRGRGLFFGAELRHADGSAASDATADLVEAMRRRGVLLNRIGPEGNILKIRPPMVFDHGHADLMIATLTEALDEVAP
ncbi:aspartate aminotransferase family protein [Brevirhabdus pacifica]|uniref:Aspartate aminotransferase family protein n=1 Tax=Brevirhabdus pacifica TaxID=1267768 RepID=A0A1U7DIY8_9RHOB|nr:aspartate aminotransferase family protein [Brevirhabdus pacifica]APX89952.1 aspartate aminotransferase family protein [Brevirhabdus pacifica]OWU74323.1 aminotransferase [Loktanella sp. 22II-4b]PJJ82817.1 4-aminobutyrate aminotransferase-like enzyme [Brevirhabdus pacifica]